MPNTIGLVQPKTQANQPIMLGIYILKIALGLIVISIINQNFTIVCRKIAGGRLLNLLLMAGD